MTAARSDSATPTDDSVTTLESLRAVVRLRLGIDPRALAAFRIGLGLIVLCDLLVLRLPGLVTFYTDAGIFPRSALKGLSPALAKWSLHALSGSAWAQGLLLAITGIFAACVLVGYRHRLAAVSTALLLASLHARNPYLVNGGDTILISLLLLAAVLPLAARWSLRPRRLESRFASGEHRDDSRVVSTATAILCLHIVVIYAINAILKFRSDAWLSGVAVQRIFRLEDFVDHAGPTVAEFPALLTAINWLWIAVLAASVLLVVAPGRLRTATVAAFVGAHLSMAATMRLGVFPFVMVAVLLVFLPPRVWDRLERLVSASGLEGHLESLMGREATGTTGPEATASGMNRGTGTLEAANAETGPTAAGSRVSPRVRRGTRIAASALLVCLFLAVVSWQVAAAGLVDTSASSDDGALGSASWAFFAPDPPDSYSWYVVEATDESGTATDLVTGDPATFERPDNAMDRYPTTLWKRYGTKGQGAGDAALESAGAYFCDRAPDGTESVTIYRVEQPVDADGPVGEPIPHEKVTRAC
ncbi:HTTM domain-containing protein [Natrinema versiforme]|uniref:HTTM domain protein n=1 Tax=Natrinema versiforme JCM 10478 TaxID=1227496 RepID=L9XYX0_9EURY|nr:HTTM domain-containing protein [Natrinema versiforme]ELY66985.1 HTTM domain protein [Natrinema versiforme JCM 10478]